MTLARFAWTFVAAVAFVVSAHGAEKASKELAGTYYRGDGTGYNVTLTLAPGRQYTAVWKGCLGTYGSARGSWSATDKWLLLEPAEEEGMMKGHLKKLLIIRGGSRDMAFVPEKDLSSDYFQQYGADNYMGFHRQEAR